LRLTANNSLFRPLRGIAARCLLAAIPLAITPAAHAAYNLSFVTDPTGNGLINLLGINGSGVIGGFDGSSGFTLTLPNNFKSENFPSPPSSGPSMVTGINAAGDTSGIYMDAAGNTHGFTDIGGTFKTVDNPLSTVFAICPTTEPVAPAAPETTTVSPANRPAYVEEAEIGGDSGRAEHA
jgi:hypothetical protein